MENAGDPDKWAHAPKYVIFGKLGRPPGIKYYYGNRPRVGGVAFYALCHRDSHASSSEALRLIR
jgi:hypothetical protein